MMTRWLYLLLPAALAGCSGERHQDLQEFVRTADKNIPRKIEPLPEVKPYEPFTYTAFDLPDPFKPRKLQPGKSDGGGLQPDLNRRKEPLESYPLESLKMVGVLQQNKSTYALVKADNTLYRIRPGNYLGQNYGLVTSITENDIKLKELVQDSGGDWTERVSALQLQEDQDKEKKK